MSELQYTTALDKIRRMNKRIRIVQGGSSSAKTFSILLDELDYSLTHDNKVTSVITDSYPNLRVGAIRDFLNICKETNVAQIGTWNKTDHTFTLPNGSIIEFYSVDTMGALGSRRDRLFVNEANRISYETFTQLEIRTKEQITLDFNPISEFYAHTELLKRPDADFVKLTYKDNEALDQNIVDALEARIGDGTSNWAKVYVFGEVGSLEGNVYSGWTAMPEEEIAKQGKLVRYGLDFGFANDETALVALYDMGDNKLGVVEKYYKRGLLGSQYVEMLKSCGVQADVLIVADSARPEIIAEIKNAGFRIIGADKNPGSVKRGIDRVSQRQIFYCGKNLEKEYYSYGWRKKRTGEVLDEPQDGMDHCMDALRYSADDLSKKRIEF